MKKQPFKKHNRYYNYQDEQPESLMFKTVFTVAQSLRNRKKRVPHDIIQWHVQQEAESCSIFPLITWIGHATFLIQSGNINIITDPIFGNASLLYSRVLVPGLSIEQLPHIDLIILSHNHRDHMDEESLMKLQKRFPEVHILVPLGDKPWFIRRGFLHVFELEWWQQHTFQSAQSATAQLTFLPAQHWSQRGLLDKNRSLWGSWMIEVAGNRIYFGGDTAYADHFIQIRESFDTISSALLPIAPGQPDPYMRRSHMDAYQAGQAFLDLNALHFIPMHWGTFLFGTDHFFAPLTRLQTWWQENSCSLQNKQLHSLKIGQRVKLE
jgi:L-ascorbate metabolism protein UlaG (beta-lactamase superfamily)